MPAPSTSLATLRPDLAGSLTEFNLKMNAEGFISQQLLPVINVDRESGKFGRIPLEQLLHASGEQGDATLRQANGGYARGNWKFTTDSYACEEHGWEKPVDDRESAIYADYFDAELVSTERAQNVIMSNAEIRTASLLFNETTFSGQITAITNEWDENHTANADPITDVNTAVNAAYDRTGIWPNFLAINRKVFRRLRALDSIKDAIASAGAGDPTKASDITIEMLKAVFDLENIFVAGGTKNSAAKGQTASLSQIWSDEWALVGRVASGKDIREPCLGRTFHYTGDGSKAQGVVETYRDETKRADIVRVRHDVDEKTLYPECCQLLNNVTT